MNYKDLDFNDLSKEMFDQLQKGAFLTTKVEDEVNTMTIAWGGLSFVWGRKVFVAYVRKVRHTFDLLEQSNEFTISVPLNADMRKALGFCGTKSGRDYDKIKESNLHLEAGRVIETPIIGDCELHYECKVIYKQMMDDEPVLDAIKGRYYPNSHYHMIYYGEILDCYTASKE